MLVLCHPAVAWRDCGQCTRFVYEHETGEVMRDRDGKPLERPTGTKPPCRYGPAGTRCAKGSPEESRGLSDRNAKAYQHYLECKATGQFPEDAIVRRNAGVIRQVEDMVSESVRRLSVMARSG